MLNFDSNDLVVGYIKEYLKEFNLPKCKVKGRPLYENDIFIWSSGLYKHTKTGDIKLLPYKFNDNITNITKNLEIKNNIYDSYTHRYLGDYLRFIRDYKHINLMSMYNCFANEYCHNIDLSFYDTPISFPSVPRNLVKFSTLDKSYKIFMVPVRFGQKYTIGIDCATQIEMFVGFYDNNRLQFLRSSFEDEKEPDVFYTYSYVKKTGCIFKHPFLYDKLCDIRLKDSEYIKYDDRYLTLFIKVPFDNHSSLTVLEGDYVEDCNVHFLNSSSSKDAQYFKAEDISAKGVINENKSNHNVYVWNYADDIIEPRNGYQRKYISQPQLFLINSEVNHPIADRLIEYLVFNVITPDCEFSEDITKLQNRLIERHWEGHIKTKDGKEYKEYYTLIGIDKLEGYRGIWDEKLRNVVYDIVVSSPLLENETSYNKYDMIGYVDKDAESIIGD